MIFFFGIQKAGLDFESDLERRRIQIRKGEVIDQRLFVQKRIEWVICVLVLGAAPVEFCFRALDLLF
jgi:hypothetical protein